MKSFRAAIGSIIYAALCWPLPSARAAGRAGRRAGIACRLALAPALGLAANDSPATATALDLNVTATQAITAAHAVDYFAVTVPAGKLSVNFKHADAGTTYAGWSVSLVNGAGAEYLGFTSGGRETDKTLSADLPGGTCYVRITDSGNGTSLDREYQLAVGVSAAQTITFGTAPTLVYGGSASYEAAEPETQDISVSAALPGRRPSARRRPALPARR